MRWCNTCNKAEDYCWCEQEGNVPDFGDEKMGGQIEQIECECGGLEFYISKDVDDMNVIIRAECKSCGEEVEVIRIEIG